MSIGDYFLTGTFQAESVPVQLAVKNCIGDSNLVTMWQILRPRLGQCCRTTSELSSSMLNGPSCVTLTHLDAPRFQGMQSLHERKGLLKRPDKYCSWC